MALDTRTLDTAYTTKRNIRIPLTEPRPSTQVRNEAARVAAEQAPATPTTGAQVGNVVTMNWDVKQPGDKAVAQSAAGVALDARAEANAYATKSNIVVPPVAEGGPLVEVTNQRTTLQRQARNLDESAEAVTAFGQVLPVDIVAVGNTSVRTYNTQLKEGS